MSEELTGSDSARHEAWAANIRLWKEGLVALTWGNVSVRDGATMLIKPSGVPYGDLQADDIVPVRIADGEVVPSSFRGSSLRPSMDTETHLALYRAFPDIGAIVHVHCRSATAFSQARLPLKCFGTTHADHFAGPVGVTRQLTADEVAEGYEANTGTVIVEHVNERPESALEVPAVLVAGHAPFVWGPTAKAAVNNSVALEECALMAAQTLALNPQATPIEPWLLQTHHDRKHGAKAYYGQPAGTQTADSPPTATSPIEDAR